MSLIDAMDATASRNPARGITFLDRRGRPDDRRAYPELVPAWRASARRLLACGAREREPVFVCLAASWEFLDVWMGALLAGARPATVAPPLVLGRSPHQFHTLERLVERFQPSLLVATELTQKRARDLGLTELADRIVTPEEVAARAPSKAPLPPSPDAADLAFLQFTSGSTGTPRAVAISHRALLATTAAIDATIPAPAPSVSPDGRGAVVSWLPLHHDMGLVGVLQLGLTRGHDIHFLSQRAFLGRPATWLRALGAVPRAFTGSPNFAYQACVERVRPEELEGVDLSGWCVGVTGSEMVRPETVAAFYEKFAGAGLRPGSIMPAYGMAETTLIVTSALHGEPIRTRPVPADDEAERHVVSVGPPVRGMRVRIAAPDGSVLPDGRVGEVLAGGDCLFDGYYQDPEATAEALRDGWLHTGDLGFVEDGELYITGRIKDLIIVNGQNVMPHELEWYAETVTDGGGSCRSGAFAVGSEHGTEAPVLVCEIETAGGPDLDALAREVRRVIGRETGLPLADVAFVRRGAIPKTSSGKVKRGELRRRYVAQELERLDAPSS